MAFQEGQDVRAGDLLAEIDPRTYEAQLHQAQADKARDEALLANAKLDFERYSSLSAAGRVREKQWLRRIGAARQRFRYLTWSMNARSLGKT